MTATTLGSLPSSSISLPPISTIHSQNATHSTPSDMTQSLHPPARTLPPPGILPYYPIQTIPQPPSYVLPGRPLYGEAPMSYGNLPPNRMPIPPPTDPNIMVAHSRHGSRTKEVKRRTKTGCMTCRKRRIKCGEEKPECRNCVKSKRQCAGYDTVLQTQPPLQTSQSPSATGSSTASQVHEYSLSSAPYYTEHTPTTLTNQVTSNITDSGRGYIANSYHRTSEPILPSIGQGHGMEGHQNLAHQHRRHPNLDIMNLNRPQSRSIEDICTIHGQRGREVPALRPDLVPNFSEIRKVYDTFFAPGLDCLLETGFTKWFALKGFDLLTNDRKLLAQFMLYLTLISNTPNIVTSTPSTQEQAAVASQEARMTWSLMNLCVRQAQEGNDEYAEKFAPRVKALEALLTSEPVVRTGSMSDFVHQEPDNEMDAEMSMEGVPTVANNPLLEKPFMKQLIARSEEFWRLIEKASEHPTTVPTEIFDQAKALLDGHENRDIIYSIMLLGSAPKQPDYRVRTGTESTTSSPNRSTWRKEKEQAARLLETEASGRATNVVLQNLAGMGLRAFVS